MIQSMTDTEIGQQEFDLISNDEHIEKVFQKVNNRIDVYLTSYKEYIEHDDNSKNRDKLCSNPDMVVKSDKKDSNNMFRSKLLAHIKNIIDEFEKERKPYLDFFDSEILEEYGLDTNTFKSSLKKDVPVIHYAVNAKSEFMKEWIVKFKVSSSEDLYDVFSNIIQFAEDYKKGYTPEDFELIDNWRDFKFDKLDYDEDYRLVGVIGTGIIATVINSLYPEIFPGNFKHGIYSLHFLAGKEISNDMPSETSEFIMVKDIVSNSNKSITSDYNYFFPYGVYSLYILRIYNILDEFLKKWDVHFPLEYRYVLTGDFFSYICFEKHKDDIAVLTGSDDIEKDGRLLQT